MNLGGRELGIPATEVLRRLQQACEDPAISEMTDEEVDAELRANGIDPEVLAKETEQRLAEIRAKYMQP